MGAGAVVALKVFPQLLGPLGYVPAAIALAVAIAVFAAAHVRYVRHGRAVIGGGLPALVALATLCLGILALAVVLASVLQRV